jgi:hypothetical protein
MKERKRCFESTSKASCDSPPNHLGKLLTVSKELQLPLPDDSDVPSLLLKGLSDPSIPRDIRCEFGLPECDPRLGCVCESAPRMPVPEASVNQKNRGMASENDIRPARKVAPMQSESIAHSMKGSPHGQLGCCIPRAYPRHHGASLFGCKNVHCGRCPDYCRRLSSAQWICQPKVE